MTPSSPTPRLHESTFAWPQEEREDEEIAPIGVFRAIFPGREDVWLGSPALVSGPSSPLSHYAAGEDESQIDPDEPPMRIETDEEESVAALDETAKSETDQEEDVITIDPPPRRRHTYGNSVHLSHHEADSDSAINAVDPPRVTREKIYDCTYCGKRYSNHNDWHTHVNKKHTGTKTHACRVAGCAKTFFGAQQRRRHENGVHNYYHKQDQQPYA